MADFGENIRKQRLKKGMTQSALADFLGVSDITVSRYETGRRKPDTETLFKIAEILNIPWSYLIFGEPTNDKITHTNDSNEDYKKISLALFGDSPDHEHDINKAQYNDAADIDKKTLIDNYDKVNADGKEKILSYSDDIASNPKYTDPDNE